MNVRLACVVSPFNDGDHDMHFAHTWVVLWHKRLCCLPVTIDVHASNNLEFSEDHLEESLVVDVCRNNVACL